MCTYNGAQFLFDQLQSIFSQTLSPDEVVICDDGSSDNTTSIIESFILDHNLADKWHLIINSDNLGYLSNFYKCCGICTGDVVFFSDQDDVWYPDKIEKMSKVFSSNSSAKVVCCKFKLIDAEGNGVSALVSPSHSKESSKVSSISIDSVFRKCEWPAMVLAFRRSWYDEWKELTFNSTIPHDYLFCSKAAEENGFFQLDEELAAHRLHGHNEAKEEYRLSILLKKGRKLDEINNYLQLLDAFETEEMFCTAYGRMTLAKKKEEMCDRKKALESGRVLRVLINGIRYIGKIRFKTFICDLLIVKQNL